MSSISLHLHFHWTNKTCKVKVDPLSTIGNLDCYDNNLIFVHNGKILSPSFSFKFYEIENEDHINIARRTVSTKKNNYFISNTRSTRYSALSELLGPIEIKQYLKTVLGYVPDQEYIQNVFNTNPSLAREASKIKDRFFQRVEGSYNLNQKVMKRFLTFQNLPVPESKIELKIGNPPRAPSTSQLPQLWNF